MKTEKAYTMSNVTNEDALRSYDMNVFQQYESIRSSKLISLKTFNLNEEDNMFYAWQCLSIVRKNGTTLDLTIKDQVDLMCLLHVLRHKNMKPGWEP